MITRFPSDVPFLSNVTVHAGTVYISGQVALDNAGASLKVQCAEIFQALDKALADAGSDKSHILKADVWLTDIRKASEFNEHWIKWLPTDAMPARAMVEAKFSHPDWCVEVAVIAAVK